MSESEIIGELAQNLHQLKNDEENNSLLKRYLTPEVVIFLQRRKTKNGATLSHIIRSGVENPQSKTGVYASDVESYALFSQLLWPIIEAYHCVNIRQLSMKKQHGEQSSIARHFSALASKHIVSTRVRACRSFPDIPFHPKMTHADYEEVETRFLNVSKGLKKLVAVYYPMISVPPEKARYLRQKGFWFPSAAEDKYLRSAQADKFHPTGRGVMVNATENLIVWVNEEDHLRFMAVQQGANIARVFGLLERTLQAYEARLDFAFDSSLGYLTFCPTNLGSTIRASVHVKLSNLGRDLENLRRLAAQNNVQVRSIGGENDNIGGDVFDISNVHRLGISELEAVDQMRTGVEALVQYESAIESG